MRKRTNRTAAALMLIMALLVSAIGPASAAEAASTQTQLTEVKLVIDGITSTAKEKAYVADGRTMVPIAPVAKAVGAKLETVQRGVKVTIGGIVIVLAAGSKQATVNGQPLLLSAAPLKKGTSLYIPFALLGNLLGLDAVYNNSKKSVEIKTSHSQAIVYGYVVDKNDQPLKQGTVDVWSNDSTNMYTASIVNGYYRLNLPEGRYKQILIHSGGSSSWDEDVSRDSFEVKKEDRLFMRLAQPQPNLTIHVQYEDGTPVKSGKLNVIGKVYAPWVEIVNGTALYTVKQQEYLFIDQIMIEDASAGQWDVYERFNADPARTHDTMTVTVHKPNVHLKVQDGGSPVQSGTITILDSTNPTVQKYQHWIDNGEDALYLPDGDYQWIDYSMMNDTGEVYDIHLAITIRKGTAANPTLIHQLPLHTVKGNLIANNGTSLANGFVSFTPVGTVGVPIASCRVNADGQFSLRLGDGAYTVSYTDSTGIERQLNDIFVVSRGQGKPAGMIVYLS
ncbi:copper amine oxidase-like protein [Paenibacillus cellulosilyticus]|uniref:Copper amine oxidase-like protein n=1 Tax=Paenibacillus cellulosilyticus TaxID=375489 RepID=A0A2V2YRU1_9BACL|nr:copper amine oxidase N-terminal domain-containing protein [Paenibacillus cellulosilyticus]PWW00864.1 copper amine oxidase-like protein [Paenibacillus cellulosilyticus]QKS47529.1 copper amine oxidase N-terminal domain-containing protein [Paenibacillus cellulosilyticus]